MPGSALSPPASLIPMCERDLLLGRTSTQPRRDPRPKTGSMNAVVSRVSARVSVGVDVRFDQSGAPRFRSCCLAAPSASRSAHTREGSRWQQEP